jgi:hypothetical protein
MQERIHLCVRPKRNYAHKFQRKYFRSIIFVVDWPYFVHVTRMCTCAAVCSHVMSLSCIVHGTHRRSLQFLCHYVLICLIITVPTAVGHFRKTSCPSVQMLTAALFIDVSIRGFYYTVDFFWQDEALCLDCSLLYL